MDYIAANLPAINFDATCDFYRMLGFQSTYQSNQWMNVWGDDSTPWQFKSGIFSSFRARS